MRKLKLFSLAVMALFATSVWGDQTYHAIVPNDCGTQYEMYGLRYEIYSSKTSVQSNFSSWVTYDIYNQSSTSVTEPSGWLDGESGHPGYGYIVVRNSKPATFYITNCTGVAIHVKGASNSSKNPLLSIKDASNNTEVGSEATTTSSDWTVLSYGTTLDRTKNYIVKLYATTDDNTLVSQIRFTAPAACSASLSGTTSNASAKTGESAGTMTCGVNNGAAASATSYQWYKTTSNKASAAAISGATSSSYSPNEASAGTYYYYCEVVTKQRDLNGTTGSCSVETDLSGAFVFAAAPVVITGAVNEAGWGTVSDAITVTNGATVSISNNVLTCDEKTLTATATAATAEYTYAFVNWTGVANGDAVTTNVIATANFSRTANSYTLAWNTNGGSELDGTYDSGSIAYGTAIAKPNDPTLDGYEFTGWNSADDGSGTDYNGTMPAANTTYYAQWIEHVKHTDATLSALSVAGCTLSPAFSSGTTAYTVALPFYASMPVVGDVTATKNDSYAANPAVSIEDNVITVHCVAEDDTKTKDYTITVNIADVPTASSSINIEQLVLDNSTKYDIGSALDAAHIAYVDKDALDSLNEAKTSRNEPYLGLKFKKATSKVTIIVPSGEYLKVKFGAINSAAKLKVSVNGSEAETPTVTDGVYTLAASTGAKEVIFTLDVADKTVVLKQIKINEAIDAVTLPWRITFDSDGGSAVKDLVVLNNEVAVKPTDPTKASNYFAGWYNGENAYDWSAKVTSNLNLKAHWSDTPTALDNANANAKAVKFFKDGQIFIEKNGVRYNAQGQIVR